jgi:hypothetical protein
MRRHATALAILLALAACHTSTTESGKVCAGADATPPDLPADDAPPFAGAWTGTLTTVLDGVEESQAAVLTVQTPGKNQLLLVDVCLGGVPGVVTGPQAFDAVCYECLPVTARGCAQLYVVYQAGSGALSADGTTLDLTLTGTRCCSTDVCPDNATPLTQTFTGTRLTPAQAGGAGAAGSFAAAAARPAP